ncbi:MAG: N-acetylmuramoyl-L-alanine amidase [Pseudomonadota bacterium]|jgi:N-acetylmuramoyl-L-alanine amidase
MTIGINIGHGDPFSPGLPPDPGAVSATGVQEHAYNTRLLHRLEPLLSVPWRRIQAPYTQLPALANAAGVDVLISLHCNSSSNPTANGTEVLHARGSVAGRALAMLLARSISASMRTRLRHDPETGSVPVEPTGRGGLLLFKTEMPTVIVEPFFISNPAELKHFTDNQGDYAQALATVLNTLQL